MNKKAFCGLDCSVCPAYEATVKDDWFARRELAAQWTSPDYPVLAEEIDCLGCHHLGDQVFIFCRDCEMRRCGITHQVSTCVECTEYPCLIIERVPAEVKNRLEEIRKLSA